MFRDKLLQRYERQMASLGAPSMRNLGPRPERKVKKYVAEITRALDWHADIWAPCEERIHKLGLDWEKFQRAKASGSHASGDLQNTRELVLSELEPLDRKSTRLNSSH